LLSKTLQFIGGAIFIFMQFQACQSNPSARSEKDISNVKDSTIYIVDRTGKQWDITHAVKHYNFSKNNFNYGLGPNAIKPINYPDMLESGDPGYPESHSSQTVIGVNINGEARAYPIDVLSSHEVVNDTLKGFYTAVAY